MAVTKAFTSLILLQVKARVTWIPIHFHSLLLALCIVWLSSVKNQQSRPTKRNLPLTRSRTSACACPRIFEAEHLYTPESLPPAFGKTNFPSVVADRIFSDFPSSLLHVDTGLGLPLTEHWKEAVFAFINCHLWRRNGNSRSCNRFTRFSFSSLHASSSHVSFLSFLSSFSLWLLAGPMMPCFPLLPGGPMIPLSPLFPVLPLFPLRPRSPLSPLGPGGPGGPGGPSEHLSSVFDWQSFCLSPATSCLSNVNLSPGVCLFSVLLFVE